MDNLEQILNEELTEAIKNSGFESKIFGSGNLSFYYGIFEFLFNFKA